MRRCSILLIKKNFKWDCTKNSNSVLFHNGVVCIRLTLPQRKSLKSALN